MIWSALAHAHATITLCKSDDLAKKGSEIRKCPFIYKLAGTGNRQDRGRESENW